MTPLTSVPRLIGIACVLLRYRLDELVEAVHLFRPLKWIRGVFGRPRADIEQLSRGARLRMALAELGPIFVKFGQILSTRRDLLPIRHSLQRTHAAAGSGTAVSGNGRARAAASKSLGATDYRTLCGSSTTRRWRRRRSREGACGASGGWS